MTPSLQMLRAARVNAIMQQLQDVRLLPDDLLFLNRTPVVPAMDNEIMASYTGYAYIADLIADDAQAVTYNAGRFALESTAVPNLKIGVAMNQDMLNQLLALTMSMAMTDDRAMFLDWETRTLDAVLLGLRQRMEALIIAMHVGSLSYDRLGITLTNVSWGRPSDLTITTNVAWDTAATATPVADILNAVLIGRVRYGVVYNRVTMSTQAFRYMIATTEFQDKATALLTAGLSFTNLSTAALGQMQDLASRLLAMEIELYDARYWYQTPAGAVANAPFLPITNVILSSTNDDDDPAVADFANGIVTESVVASLAQTTTGDLGGRQRGPIAYTTASPDLNPPNVTYWGVARGFPRLHRKAASACLTVGSFTDTIPTTEPVLT
jgi:hypothetical protein